MKKTGIFLISTAAVAAAATTAKLIFSHLNEKEQEKWHKYWAERHAEAAEARAKATEAAKAAAEKAKHEVAELKETAADAVNDVADKVKSVLKEEVDEKEEVLEDLHGALTNYLGKKKEEDIESETSDEPESEEANAGESTEPTEEESEEEKSVENAAPVKAPAPPVDNDSDEEPLPAWDVVPIIGDGEGKISPSSEEYVALVKEAIAKAEAEPTYHLVLSGKTYGLGAKGKSVGGDTAFNLEDLRKLLRKAESKAE